MRQTDPTFAASNLLETTDPAGMVTQFGYDAAGRQTQVIENYTASPPSSSSSSGAGCGPSPGARVHWDSGGRGWTTNGRKPRSDGVRTRSPQTHPRNGIRHPCPRCLRATDMHHWARGCGFNIVAAALLLHYGPGSTVSAIGPSAS